MKKSQTGDLSRAENKSAPTTPPAGKNLVWERAGASITDRGSCSLWTIQTGSALYLHTMKTDLKESSFFVTLVAKNLLDCCLEAIKLSAFVDGATPHMH